MAGVVALRIKAHAVVVHLQADLAAIVREPDRHPAGLGMPGYVVQCLLGDAVEGFPGFDGKHRFRAELGVHVQLVADARRVRLAREGHHQAFFLQRIRPQLKDERPHLGQAGLSQREHVGQRLSQADFQLRRDWRAIQQRLGSTRAQTDAIEHLRNRVVQLAGQPLPFLQGCQPPRLPIQPGVLNSGGCLVGDRLGQGSMMPRIGPGLPMMEAQPTDHPILDHQRDAYPGAHVSHLKVQILAECLPENMSQPGVLRHVVNDERLLPLQCIPQLTRLLATETHLALHLLGCWATVRNAEQHVPLHDQHAGPVIIHHLPQLLQHQIQKEWKVQGGGDVG